MNFTDLDSADPTALVRDVQWLVRELPLFRDLDPTLLDALSDAIEWLALPGGMTLFEDGDLPDALYFVVNGTLGATRRRRMVIVAWSVALRAVRPSARWR